MIQKGKTALHLIVLGIRLGYGIREKCRLASFLLLSRVTRPQEIISKAFRIHTNFSPATVYIRNNFSDAFILHEVFQHNEYEHDLPTDAPSTIFDVGANIGLVTVYLSAKYPQAHIHCFEPDPENYAQLIENTRDLPRVTCYQVAIGDVSGTIAFYQNGTFHMRNSVLPSVDATRIEVPSITLTESLSLAGVPNIDLLKVDVEGGEVGIFTSEAPYERIKSIIGELHPYNIQDSVYQDLLSRLKKQFGLRITTEGKKVFVYGKRR